MDRMVEASGAVLDIEVILALPEQAHVVPLQVTPGTTIRQAIEQSGLLRHCSGTGVDFSRVGIHGRLRDPDTPVSDGDRVEIYRPLRIDPKEARRRRAAARRQS